MSSRQRAILLSVIAVIAAVAVGTGVFGVVAGPVTSGEAQHVATSTDSEYRFLSGLWASSGLVCWWALRRPEERTSIILFFLACCFAGGLGRLISLLAVGYPGLIFLGSLTVELLVIPVIGVSLLRRRHALPAV